MTTHSPSLRIYKRIATVFIVSTIVLLAILFYFALTYASVTITPRPEKAHAEVTIAVTENQSEVNAEKGVFAGSIINQEFTKSDTFQATGKDIFQNNLTGKVTIFNNNSSDQALVKTTRLLTANNELFRLSESVIVPANGKLETNAYQDEKSVAKEIKLGTSFTIPGLNPNLQKLIYAQAASDFSGQSSEVAYLTKDDLDNAQKELINRINTDINANSQADLQVIAKSDLVSKDFSSLAGEKVSDFKATVKVNVLGATFKRSEVMGYLVKNIESSLSDDKQLLKLKPEDVAYTIDTYDDTQKTLQIKVSVDGLSTIRKDAAILSRDRMVGLTADELKTTMENMKEIEKVEVKFFPFWVRKVPSFLDHIIVDVKSVDGSVDNSQ